MCTPSPCSRRGNTSIHVHLSFLDSLKKYTSLLEDEAAARAVYSTIGALSQIIFRCPELKNEFYRLDGTYDYCERVHS